MLGFAFFYKTTFRFWKVIQLIKTKKTDAAMHLSTNADHQSINTLQQTNTYVNKNLTGHKNLTGQEELDKQYFAAIEAGDMETVQKLVNEQAEKKGYNANSEYQGTSAFNGAAPYRNGYFDTKEERLQAIEEGSFE